MTITPARWLVAVVPLSLVVACRTAPDRSIAGTIAASHTSDWSPWSEPVDLGPVINSAFGDQNAALSKDGRSLYFVSNRPGHGGTDLWVAQRTGRDAPWGEPVNLGPIVNGTANEGAPELSRDGHWLFFHSNRVGSLGATDIWASYRQKVHDDFAWQPPVNLGTGVNTPGPENAPSYFENDDGDAPQLFFTRGPTATTDIYVSELTADGTWGPASPVVELNDPAVRDGSPAITPSGLEIFFDSNRDRSGTPPRTHLFVATRHSVLDPWSTPVELGPPILTSDGEFIPFTSSHGDTETLLFTRDLRHDGIFSLWQSTRTRAGKE